MPLTIKVIAFDADDTLWVNEPYFQDTEKKFCELLRHLLPPRVLAEELLKIEIANLPLYGYGIKGYILSMIEAALSVSRGTVDSGTVAEIIGFGKELLNQPVELLDDVPTVLETLQAHYRLVVATKGDLLDQERKLYKSGISHFFHHVEIMSNKEEKDYLKLIRHLDVRPDEFLMIGNSVKSDIIPVLNIGAHAIHVPFHTTWAHEVVDIELRHDNFLQLTELKAVLTELLGS